MDEEHHALEPFLESARAKGASDEFLARLLAAHGWPEKEIYRAFRGVYERLTGQAVPDRRAHRGEQAREAFLYLLSFSTLCTWAVGLGALLFALIERAYPNAVVQGWGLGFRQQAAPQMASILVAFPVYLFVMWLIGRDLNADPARRESGVRKWLTYIALLITAGIAVGDVITFLTYFLQGELAVRFVLKVAVVLVIAGGIFWYYFRSLKLAGGASRFGLAAAVAICAALAGGFWNLGSPVNQRAIAADERRVSDLSNLTNAIYVYSTGRRAGEPEPRPLPKALSDLPGSGYRWRDPVTQQPYEYRPLTATAYELCATFAEDAPAEGSNRFPVWTPFADHHRGRQCFTLSSETYSGRPLH